MSPKSMDALDPVLTTKSRAEIKGLGLIGLAFSIEACCVLALSKLILGFKVFSLDAFLLLDLLYFLSLIFRILFFGLYYSTTGVLVASFMISN